MYIRGAFVYYFVIGFVVNQLTLSWPVQAAVLIFLLTTTSTFIYKKPFYVVLFYVVVIHFVFLVSDLLLGSLLAALYGQPFRDIIVSSTSGILFSILSKVASLVISLLLVGFFSKTSYRLPQKYWILLNLISIFDIIVAFVVAVYIMPILGGSESSVMFIAIIAFVLTFILVILLFSSISEYHYREELYVSQKSTSENLQEQITLMNEKDNAFSKYRHEWANNLNTLRQMASVYKNQDIVTYIEQMVQIMPEGRERVDCGIPSLDAVLTMKKSLCEESGVTLHLHFSSVYIEHINGLDIAAVVSNLVDNAFQAVLWLNTEQRIIDFFISRLNDMITVRVINQYSSPISYTNGYLKSSKRSNGAHGWGLIIVEDICEKYHGFLNIDHKENRFNACAFLQDIDSERFFKR